MEDVKVLNSDWATEATLKRLEKATIKHFKESEKYSKELIKVLKSNKNNLNKTAEELAKVGKEAKKDAEALEDHTDAVEDDRKETLKHSKATEAAKNFTNKFMHSLGTAATFISGGLLLSMYQAKDAFVKSFTTSLEMEKAGSSAFARSQMQADSSLTALRKMAESTDTHVSHIQKLLADFGTAISIHGSRNFVDMINISNEALKKHAITNQELSTYTAEYLDNQKKMGLLAKFSDMEHRNKFLQQTKDMVAFSNALGIARKEVQAKQEEAVSSEEMKFALNSLAMVSEEGAKNLERSLKSLGPAIDTNFVNMMADMAYHATQGVKNVAASPSYQRLLEEGGVTLAKDMARLAERLTEGLSPEDAIKEIKAMYGNITSESNNLIALVNQSGTASAETMGIINSITKAAQINASMLNNQHKEADKQARIQVRLMDTWAQVTSKFQTMLDSLVSKEGFMESIDAMISTIKLVLEGAVESLDEVDGRGFGKTLTKTFKNVQGLLEGFNSQFGDGKANLFEHIKSKLKDNLSNILLGSLAVIAAPAFIGTVAGALIPAAVAGGTKLVGGIFSLLFKKLPKALMAGGLMNKASRMINPGILATFKGMFVDAPKALFTSTKMASMLRALPVIGNIALGITGLFSGVTAAFDEWARLTEEGRAPAVRLVSALWEGMLGFVKGVTGALIDIPDMLLESIAWFFGADDLYRDARERLKGWMSDFVDDMAIKLGISKGLGARAEQIAREYKKSEMSVSQGEIQGEAQLARTRSGNIHGGELTSEELAAARRKLELQKKREFQNYLKENQAMLSDPMMKKILASEFGLNLSQGKNGEVFDLRQQQRPSVPNPTSLAKVVNPDSKPEDTIKESNIARAREQKRFEDTLRNMATKQEVFDDQLKALNALYQAGNKQIEILAEIRRNTAENGRTVE